MIALLLGGGVVAVYTGVLLLLWRYQERVVFQPPADVARTIETPRQFHYRAADGVELFAYVVGERAALRPVVLAFHGNAEIARWQIPWALEVTRLTGACVVLAEYRGYDGLSGIPTYRASTLDAHAALDFAKNELRASADQLVYFGHSLGSAIATELASDEPPHTLVLQSPLSSAREMARRLAVPGVSMFWGMVSRVHFDTEHRVRSLASPVWVVHGDKDIIIPVSMGRRVFEAAAHKGQLLVVPGAGHNDVASVGGVAYWAWLQQAIRGVSLEINQAAPVETRSEP